MQFPVKKLSNNSWGTPSGVDASPLENPGSATGNLMLLVQEDLHFYVEATQIEAFPDQWIPLRN